MVERERWRKTYVTEDDGISAAVDRTYTHTRTHMQTLFPLFSTCVCVCVCKVPRSLAFFPFSSSPLPCREVRGKSHQHTRHAPSHRSRSCDMKANKVRPHGNLNPAGDAAQRASTFRSTDETRKMEEENKQKHAGDLFLFSSSRFVFGTHSCVSISPSPHSKEKRSTRVTGSPQPCHSRKSSRRSCSWKQLQPFPPAPAPHAPAVPRPPLAPRPRGL